MQFRILNFILFAYYAIGVTANTLQCYECVGDECNNLNDSMLNYCGPQSTTTQPTTTKGITKSTTLEPNTTTDGDTESTTSTATTTTTTSSTTSKTTESSQSSTSDDITETTVASTSSPTTETTVSIVESSPQEQTYSVRRRRSLPLNSKILPADVLLANYRLSSYNVRADSSWYCYSASIPDGDSSKRKHGCVEVAAESTPCDAVRELNNIPPNTDTNEYDCYTCQTEKCNNGAGHLQGITMITLLAVVIVQKLYLLKF